MRFLLPLADGFDELEAGTILSILRKADIETVVSGVPGTIIKSHTGLKVLADKQLDEKDAESADGLVLVGGAGYKALLNSQKLLAMAARLDARRKVIAAIGTAPCILSKAGILENRMAAVYPGLERELAKPRKAKVIVDNNIITAGMPMHAADFALKVVEVAVSKGKAEEIRRYLAPESV
ncbi:MAG: DJ-1/PfpI family protein [Candidatus Aenigmarchaeota archaeon]|nr:DJ-1/PfpI family protein [Candidatus Aenigmarchaeota archaeon]